MACYNVIPVPTSPPTPAVSTHFDDGFGTPTHSKGWSAKVYYFFWADQDPEAEIDPY